MRFGSGPPSRPFDVPKQVRLVRVTRSLQYFFSQHYFAASLLLCSSAPLLLEQRAGNSKNPTEGPEWLCKVCIQLYSLQASGIYRLSM